jgi:hypothetical protein
MIRITEELVLLLIKMTAQANPIINQETAEFVGTRLAEALRIIEGPHTKFNQKHITALVEKWRADGSLPPQVLH